MHGLTLDLRYVYRVLIASPGFAGVAILSLAIGIGANTAIFSIVRSLLLDSLPVEQPEQLALIYRSTPELRTSQVNSSGYQDPATGANYNSNFSYELYTSIREAARDSADVFGYNFLRQLSVSIEGQPAIIAGGLLASGNYFSALRLGTTLGRPFDEQDVQPGAAPVAVISHAFWIRAFGRDRQVLGRNIAINGTPVQIIGVTQAGFQGLSQGGFFPATEITLPISMQPVITPRWAGEGISMFTAPNHFWVRMVARMKPGASRERLEEALSGIFHRGLTEAGLLQNPAQTGTVRLLPGHRGLESLRRNTERPLYLLAGVVALVLLIACVNLASLMLARGVARQRETAVRQAIGANRFRLIRQSLLESLILAVAGGAAGLLLAVWSGPLMTQMLTAGLEPVVVEFLIDWKILSVTAIVACTSAILFGLLPALRLTAVRNPNSHLGHRTSGGVVPHMTIGRSLIAIQVAISIPLVVGAGLFLRTIHNLGSIDLGFNPEGLVVFRLDPTLNDNDVEKHARIYHEVLERLEAIPGVRSATLIENPLISGITSSTRATINGQAVPVYKNAVGPRFFETMDMPIVAGRGLGLQDHEGAVRVAVINETLARRYFTGSPIGQRITYGSRESPREDVIVGVVADSKYSSLRREADPTLYDAFLQREGGPGALSVVMRVAVPAPSLEPLVGRAVSDVDRHLPVMDFKTQNEHIDAAIGRERAFARILVLFGGFALLLACIGLHGVTSYSVARRTSEIGIRLALGAQRRQVLWLILRQVVFLAVAGSIIGVPIAIVAGPAAGALLYGVAPSDPLTIVVAGILMFTVALLAGYLPARRASRIEVLSALRHE
jgi:predicted permease